MKTLLNNNICHPNILCYKNYAYYPTKQYAYIITEYLDNYRDMAKIITDNNNNISNENIISIMKQLVGALQYVHDKKIVHGDIKPNNIMVSTDYKNVKLIDFGLSSLNNNILNKCDEVNVNKCLGTLFFIC